MMKRGVILVFLLLFSYSVQATNYYVEKGTACTSNYPSCGIESKPFDDIDSCAKIMRAGDTCLVKNGIYSKGVDSEAGNPYQPSNSGLVGNPITFKNYPGHKPLIKGSSGVIWDFGTRSKRDYITYSGFKVEGVLSLNGNSETSRSKGIVIENFEIVNGGGKDDGNYAGIFAQWVEDLTIKDSMIRDIDSGSGRKGLTIFNGRRTIVENNHFKNTQSECVFDKEGGEDNVYRRNIFENCEVALKINNQGDNNGIQNVRTKIYENIFNCKNSVGNEAVRMLNQPTDWEVYNNVGYECDGLIVRSNSGPADGGIVYNNIWFGSTNRIMFESWNGDDREPDYLDNNIYELSARYYENRFSGSEKSYNSLNAWSSAAHPKIYDRNSKELDPKFVNVNNNDFHLQSTSPGKLSGRFGLDIGAYPRSDNTVIGPRGTSSTIPITTSTTLPQQTPTSTTTTSTTSTTLPGNQYSCSNLMPGTIWCDDFEDPNKINQYFEYDDNNGGFVRQSNIGKQNSYGMSARFSPGQDEAGNLKIAVGKHPFARTINSNANYNDLYWKFDIRTSDNWIGGAHGGALKVTRGTTLANSNWAQGMIAHLWGSADETLTLDPASGIDVNGNLITTTYNDFNNLRWMGSVRGRTPILSTSYAGKWACVEVHAKLNTPGQSDGLFEFWIDNNLEARKENINWHSTWNNNPSNYMINSIFFENHWNGGPSQTQYRYWDNIVIGTQRIGCYQGSIIPTTTTLLSTTSTTSTTTTTLQQPTPPPQTSGTPTQPNLKVAFIGDQGLGSSSESVLQLIKQENANLVIHSGDFDYGDNPDAWDNQINNILGSNYPYFASVGNHDEGEWQRYQQKIISRISRIPDAQCSGDIGVKSTCKYKGLFFILSGAGILDSNHETYIRDQLANDNSIWSVCSWHKNQREMQVGGKSSEVGWGPYEECRLGGAIIATAHEHTYHRTRTLSDIDTQTVDSLWPDAVTLRTAEGSTFVFVSGLGGRSIRTQQRCLPTSFPYGCKGEWANIYTSNQGAKYGALFIIFNVDGNPNKAQGYFKNIDGQIIDSFTIYSQMGAPIPGSCTLTQASWNTESIQQGQLAQLIVRGNDCNGKSISFNVYEDDIFPFNDDPALNNPASAIFNGDMAISTWIAEYVNDVIGDPEYYFIARLEQNPDINIKSNNLLSVSPVNVPTTTTIITTTTSPPFTIPDTTSTTSTSISITTTSSTTTTQQAAGNFRPFGTITVKSDLNLNGAGTNIDSIAFWESDDSRNTLMFVTAKANNLVEVWKYPFVNNELSPLRFSTSANGVAVDQEKDELFVGESGAKEVTVFSLPSLTQLRKFGKGSIGTGETNLDVLKHSNGEIRAYVTDDHNVYAFNAQTGSLITKFSPPVVSIETILADDYHQLIHVPEEQGAAGNEGIYVYRPNGTAFLKNGSNRYGNGPFVADEEGITKYSCPSNGLSDDGRGFIIVTDQATPLSKFEFFDRQTWQHLGTLKIEGVSNTDGIASTQKLLPDYLVGIFAAVDDDTSVAIVSWNKILTATGLNCGSSIPSTTTTTLQQPIPVSTTTTTTTTTTSLHITTTTVRTITTTTNPIINPTSTTLPSNQGLVAYFKFDEGSGNNLIDHAGNNQGIVNGATWVPGVIGKALYFDGNNDYIKLPSKNIFSYPMTMTAWINSRGPDFHVLLYSSEEVDGNGFGTDNECNFGLGRASNEFGVYCRTFVDEHVDYFPRAINHNQWHHVAVVFGANTTVYVDGQYIGGSISTMSTPNFNNYLDSQTYIGRASTGPDRYYDGMIDELRIYNKALTESEINAISKLSIAPTGAVVSISLSSENKFIKDFIIPTILLISSMIIVGSLYYYMVNPKIPFKRLDHDYNDFRIHYNKAKSKGHHKHTIKMTAYKRGWPDHIVDKIVK